MKRLVNRIKNNQMLKAILTLGIGTVTGQVISLLSQPILTTLCSPELLGTYSIVISLASIVIPIASLKLELLIVTEKDNIEADKITQTCCRLSYLVAILSLIYLSIMYFYGSTNIAKLGANILLFPILIVVHGFRIIFTNYSNRFRDYKIVSKAGVWRSLILTLIQLSSAFIGGGSLGQTIGYSISPLYAMKRQTQRYREHLKYRSKLKIQESIQIVKSNLSHILNLVPAEFVNTFAFSAITLTVSGLFGTATVGYYSLSIRILVTPLALISVNVSQVFLKTIASKIQENLSAYECCLKTLKGLLFISIVGFTILFFIAPYVCERVFGIGWGQAGIYISILCPMYASKFVVTSLTGVYTVAKSQKNQLIIQITFLLACGLLYLFTKSFSWNIEIYLAITSIVYTLLYVVMLIDIVRVCRKVDLGVVKL